MEIKAINKEICITIRRTQEELRACTNDLIALEVRATKSQAEVNKWEAEWGKNPTEEIGTALDRAYDKHDIVMTEFDNAQEYIEHLNEALVALQIANRALKSII